MTLLRWSFACLMFAFASGLMATGTASPMLSQIGMNLLYTLTIAFVILASLGTFVFPKG